MCSSLTSGRLCRTEGRPNSNAHRAGVTSSLYLQHQHQLGIHATEGENEGREGSRAQAPTLLAKDLRLDAKCKF